MKLSLFSDYSLRVLMYAALKGELFLLDEVSEAYAISRNHVAQVVHNLARLGYLHTQRGRGGGIQLAVAPESIRLGKLVRETEDQPVFVECFDPASNTCRIRGSCRLKGYLSEAVEAFFAELDRHTLHDLLSGAQAPHMRKAVRLPTTPPDSAPRA